MHTITANNINGKEDLKVYTNDELSMRVFNDETLYSMRYNRKELFNIIDELFDYTMEQEMVLLDDLSDDVDTL